MNRREFFCAATVGASAIAGCVGTRRQSTQFPTVEVEQQTTTTDAGLEFVVEKVAEYSTSSPAEIEMTLTNTTGSATEIIFGGSPPYSRYWGQRETGETLVVVPGTRNYLAPKTGTTAEFLPAEADGECWQASAEIVGQDVALERTLEPGESVAETYAAVSQANSECLSRGSYRFEPMEHTTEFDVVLK